LRAELVRAAKATPGVTSAIILAYKVKPKTYGGWNVDRKGAGNGRRSK